MHRAIPIALAPALLAIQGCPSIEAVEPDDDMIEELNNNEMGLDGIEDNAEITFDVAVQESLTGYIIRCQGDEFSFAIAQDPIVVQAANLAAADGGFDEDVEAFTITVDPSLTPGSYVLRLYAVAVADVDHNAKEHYTLILVDSSSD